MEKVRPSRSLSLVLVRRVFDFRSLLFSPRSTGKPHPPSWWKLNATSLSETEGREELGSWRRPTFCPESRREPKEGRRQEGGGKGGEDLDDTYEHPLCILSCYVRILVVTSRREAKSRRKRDDDEFRELDQPATVSFPSFFLPSVLPLPRMVAFSRSAVLANLLSCSKASCSSSSSILLPRRPTPSAPASFSLPFFSSFPHRRPFSNTAASRSSRTPLPLRPKPPNSTASPYFIVQPHHRQINLSPSPPPQQYWPPKIAEARAEYESVIEKWAFPGTRKDANLELRCESKQEGRVSSSSTVRGLTSLSRLSQVPSSTRRVRSHREHIRRSACVRSMVLTCVPSFHASERSEEDAKGGRRRAHLLLSFPSVPLPRALPLVLLTLRSAFVTR